MILKKKKTTACKSGCNLTKTPKMADGGHWIQGAIKHPGALRASAKAAGAINSSGKIDKGWIASKAKSKGKIGQRARLAQTLAKMAKGGILPAMPCKACPEPKKAEHHMMVHPKEMAVGGLMGPRLEKISHTTTGLQTAKPELKPSAFANPEMINYYKNVNTGIDKDKTYLDRIPESRFVYDNTATKRSMDVTNEKNRLAAYNLWLKKNGQKQFLQKTPTGYSYMVRESQPSGTLYKYGTGNYYRQGNVPTEALEGLDRSMEFGR